MTTDEDRARMLEALGQWIRQRPGFDPGNYDRAGYLADTRAVGRDLADARTLLRAVELSSMGADTLRDAFPRAFSGRLTWDGTRLDYCTGQYWPTEYRKAACAVLARALWAHYRDDFTGDDAATRLRAMFRRMFGRGIAARWFS